MGRSLVLVALFLTLASDFAVAAQEAVALDGAIREALGHNAALRASRATAEVAGAGVTEARSGWFPRVSVSESWQRGDQPVFVFSSLLSSRRFGAANFAIDALNHPDSIGFFRTSVGIEQTLFDAGRQRAAVQSAAARQEMASLGVDEAAADLVLSTTRTFGRIVTANASRRAAESAVAAAREDLTSAERRRDAGLLTDADVLALATHVADVQQRLIQAQGDADVARAELSRAMGQPIDRPFDIVEPTTLDSAADEPTPLDALLAEADRARPELKRAAAASRLAAAGRAGARSAFFPQVAAQAGLDVSGTSVADRASAWIVGGEVRWMLSLGGAERARLAAESAAATRASAEADEAGAAVHVEVVTALRRLETARARETVGRTALDQARESQRILRDRFDAGMAPVGDVLRASSAVLDADAQRTAALVDAMVGDAMLRRAVGREP